MQHMGAEASENTCFSSSSTVEELLSPDCCPLPGGGLAEATLALLMEMCLRIALQKHTPRKPATSTHDANLDAIAKNKDKKKRRKAKRVGGCDAPLQAEATLLPLLITEDSHDLDLASSVRLAAYPGRETDCNPTSSMTVSKPSAPSELPSSCEDGASCSSSGSRSALEPHNRAPQPSAASKPRESVPQPSAASEQHNRAPPPSAASKPRESAPQSAAASEPHNRAPPPSAAPKPQESAPQPAVASEHHNRAPPSPAASKPRESVPQPAAASEPHNRAPPPSAASKPRESVPRPSAASEHHNRAPPPSAASKPRESVPRPSAASEPHNRAPPPSAASKPRESVPRPSAASEHHNRAPPPSAASKPRESVPRPSAASEHHNRAPPPSAASKPRESVPRPSAASTAPPPSTASVAQASALSLSTGRQATVSSKQAKGSIKSKPEISRCVSGDPKHHALPSNPGAGKEAKKQVACRAELLGNTSKLHPEEASPGVRGSASYSGSHPAWAHASATLSRAPLAASTKQKKSQPQQQRQWGGLNERPDGCHDKDYNLRSTDHKSKRVIGQDEMLNTSCRKVSAMPPPKEVDTVIHLLQTSNGVQEGRLSVESVASVAGDSPSLNSRQECAQNIPSPGFSNLPDQPQLSDPGKTPSPALPQHSSTSSSSRSGQEGCKDRPSAEARLSPMEDHHSLHGPRSSIDSHLQEVENVSEKLRESTESRLGPPGIEAEESVFNLQDESETNGNWTSYDAQNVPSTNMQEEACNYALNPGHLSPGHVCDDSMSSDGRGQACSTSYPPIDYGAPSYPQPHVDGYSSAPAYGYPWPHCHPQSMYPSPPPWPWPNMPYGMSTPSNYAPHGAANFQMIPPTMNAPHSAQDVSYQCPYVAVIMPNPMYSHFPGQQWGDTNFTQPPLPYMQNHPSDPQGMIPHWVQSQLVPYPDGDVSPVHPFRPQTVMAPQPVQFLPQHMGTEALSTGSCHDSEWLDHGAASSDKKLHPAYLPAENAYRQKGA
eukprot:gene8511-4869_t